MATFFFCGIGGIGMSGIALCLQQGGHTVLGSDRAFDNGQSEQMKTILTQAGIRIVPQNGSGVTSDIHCFVVSSAVEPSIIDVQKALEHKLIILTRAQVLAYVFARKKYIAVGGTSGKTTVTAMIGHILSVLNKNPLMINGGISINTYNGAGESNIIYNESEIGVMEADESDGSIELYKPAVSVLNNISQDHKEVSENLPLFARFIDKATLGGVLNADCPNCALLRLYQQNIKTFSVTGKKADLSPTDIMCDAKGIRFSLNGKEYTLPFIGLHNLENALAAVCACSYYDIAIEDCMQALMSFKGTKRRLQCIGMADGVSVTDDYAHNPAKINAALSAVQQHKGNIYVYFQPHGFGPLKMMQSELIEMLKTRLDDRTTWLMSEPFYAGGTVNRDISSQTTIEALQQTGKKALLMHDRQEALDFLKSNVHSGDHIVIMGARDNSLTTYAEEILEVLKEKK